MKFIRSFEGIVPRMSPLEYYIEEYWGVDPYEFKDILQSSLSEVNIWGSIYMNFSLIYPTPSEEAEIKPIFYMGMSSDPKDDDHTITNGPYHNNLESILETGEYSIIIEAWVSVSNEEDWDRMESFMDIQNSRMESANIPYKMDWPEGINDAIYLHFVKI